jgi:putative hydrolase of the HAD superfamily
MPIPLPDRVVLFDYGEVISRSPNETDRDILLALAGVDAAGFWEAYWRHRDALDAGRMSIPEYWRTVATDLGVEWSPSTIHALWVADFRSWISIEPGTVDLLAELHEGGTRIALLSNAGFDFAGPFRYSPMAEYFERMFVSAEMNNVKPDPAIYLEVAAELGITPQQLVFIDNRSVNTDAAAELGATVHHFITTAALRGFLEDLADN